MGPSRSAVAGQRRQLVSGPWSGSSGWASTIPWPTSCSCSECGSDGMGWDGIKSTGLSMSLPLDEEGRDWMCDAAYSILNTLYFILHPDYFIYYTRPRSILFVVPQPHAHYSWCPLFARPRRPHVNSRPRAARKVPYTGTRHPALISLPPTILLGPDTPPSSVCSVSNSNRARPPIQVPSSLAHHLVSSSRCWSLACGMGLGCASRRRQQNQLTSPHLPFPSPPLPSQLDGSTQPRPPANADSPSD